MKQQAIGIDLGGTKIAGALVDPDGCLANEVRLPTRAEEGPGRVIDRILECIAALRDAASGPVVGVGIGAAGSTDSRRGVVLLASNLKWANVPLRDLVAERLGPEWQGRVFVDKDTNAAALGEMRCGAGRGARHLLYVTVGTGVGGGMVLDGRLYHGASEGASDIGHLVLEPSGALCGCGKRGCLETLASGPAIARQARVALDEGRPSSLAELNRASLTGVDVVQAAEAGDSLASEVLGWAGHYLGVALAYYVDLNNPELILIGGGVAAAGDLLLAPIRSTIAERALPNNAQAARVVLAGLGPDSGTVGAASLVFHGLEAGLA
jgi:glucokinase